MCVVFWEQPQRWAWPDFLYIDGDTGDVGTSGAYSSVEVGSGVWFCSIDVGPCDSFCSVDVDPGDSFGSVYVRKKIMPPKMNS